MGSESSWAPDVIGRDSSGIIVDDLVGDPAKDSPNIFKLSTIFFEKQQMLQLKKYYTEMIKSPRAFQVYSVTDAGTRYYRLWPWGWDVGSSWPFSADWSFNNVVVPEYITATFADFSAFLATLYVDKMSIQQYTVVEDQIALGGGTTPDAYFDDYSTVISKAFFKKSSNPFGDPKMLIPYIHFDDFGVTNVEITYTGAPYLLKPGVTVVMPDRGDVVSMFNKDDSWILVILEDVYVNQDGVKIPISYRVPILKNDAASLDFQQLVEKYVPEEYKVVPVELEESDVTYSQQEWYKLAGTMTSYIDNLGLIIPIWFASDPEKTQMYYQSTTDDRWVIGNYKGEMSNEVFAMFDNLPVIGGLISMLSKTFITMLPRVYAFGRHNQPDTVLGIPTYSEYVMAVKNWRGGFYIIPASEDNYNWFVNKTMSVWKK
ncbi:MAG: hypothetical protein H7836_15790 [Magnetococcus sp. YQC-3]